MSCGIRGDFRPRSNGLIVQRRVRPFGVQHVLGHLQHDRAGRAGAQRGEGATHEAGNIVHACKGPTPFDQTIENTRRHLLLVLLAEIPQGMLSHEQEHRHIVRIAIGDAGQGVGGPWTGAAHGHPHFAGGAGIAVGDFDAETFVAGGKDANAVRRPQWLPERRQAPA